MPSFPIIPMAHASGKHNTQLFSQSFHCSCALRGRKHTSLFGSQISKCIDKPCVFLNGKGHSRLTTDQQCAITAIEPRILGHLHVCLNHNKKIINQSNGKLSHSKYQHWPVSNQHSTESITNNIPQCSVFFWFCFWFFFVKFNATGIFTLYKSIGYNL